MIKKYLHKNTKICMHAHAKERLLKEEHQNARKTTNDYSFQKTLYRLAFRSDWIFSDHSRYFSPKTKKFLKRLENALSEFLIYFSLFVFFVEKSFFVSFFDFWSIFFVDFAISLAAMSLEYSLAKARGNYSLQIYLDFQIITILRSRF